MKELRKVEFIQKIEENTIFKIDEVGLESNSIKVYDVDGDITFSYLGGGYLQIENIPLNKAFIVEFEKTIQVYNQESVEERLKKLEVKTQELKDQNDMLYRALSERVDKHSFRVWLKAVESKMGIQIVDKDLLGIAGVNSYQK